MEQATTRIKGLYAMQNGIRSAFRTLIRLFPSITAVTMVLVILNSLLTLRLSKMEIQQTAETERDGNKQVSLDRLCES